MDKYNLVLYLAIEPVKVIVSNQILLKEKSCWEIFGSEELSCCRKSPCCNLYSQPCLTQIFHTQQLLLVQHN